MAKSNYNISKTFLLPLIAEVIGVEKRFIDYLENTYMFDFSREYENCIFIEHEFSFKNPEFTAYEHRLTDNQYFVKCIDVKDRVIYIFKFPEEYLPEYNMLIDGKYSKFGKDAKSLILRFWTDAYGKSKEGIEGILKIKQILYKDSKLKTQLEEVLSSKNHKVVIDDDAELGGIIDIENETIKLNIS